MFYLSTATKIPNLSSTKARQYWAVRSGNCNNIQHHCVGEREEDRRLTYFGRANFLRTRQKERSLSLLLIGFIRHVAGACIVSAGKLKYCNRITYCCVGLLKMPLPKELKVSELHSARLVLLKKTDTGVEEVDVFTGKEVLTQKPGTLGTLVFVVRRPG